jgi:hypothetical protein
MRLPTLSALWRSRSECRVARRKPVSIRPTVEALEDRSVPSFLAPVTSSGGGGSLAAGDFNHDGRDDIVFIGAKDNLTVSLSNGDGTFRQSSVLAFAKGKLFSTGVSDVNGDGNLDVVAVGSGGFHNYVCGYYGCFYDGSGYRNVWLGKGDGTFFARPTITTTTIYFQHSWPPVTNSDATLANFNRDALLDTAIVDASAGTVNVYLSNLGPPQSYPAGSNPESVAAGDFNGDGWIDLIVVNSLSSGKPTLSVLFNDGSW